MIRCLNSRGLIKKTNRNNLIFKPWIYSLLLTVVVAFLGTASQALAELQQGSSGTEVYALQQRLWTLHYLRIPPDGVFGPMTKQALSNFQLARGLSPDGIYGIQTEMVLDQAYQQELARRNPTTPSPSYNPLPNEDTSSIQQRLKAKGFYTGDIDGIMGYSTINAIKQFQQAVRLYQNGLVDAETRRLLFSDDTNSGQVSKGRYSVIIPGNQDMLSKVKPFVNTAVLDQSALGFYVDAGDFIDRSPAEERARMLQSHGFDARVEFR